MKQMILSVLLVVAVVAAPSAAWLRAPDEPQSLSALMVIIDALEERVEALEAENQTLRGRVAALEAGLAPAPTTLPTAPALTLVMHIEEMRPYVLSVADRKAISDLRTQVTTLERQAREKRQSADKDENKAKRRRLIKESIEMDREHKRLRIEADKLQRYLASGHYWLMGWDGARDIMLWTDGVAYGAIQPLAVGQYVRWEGERIEVALGRPGHADFATYKAQKVEGVRGPANWKPRPLNRKPVWSPDPWGRSTSGFPRLPRSALPK